MRLVIQIKEQEKAQRFALFLKEKEIPSQMDQKNNLHDIWVFDEDDMEKAQQAYKEFEASPSWTPSVETLEKERQEALKLEEEKLIKQLQQESFSKESEMPDEPQEADVAENNPETGPVLAKPRFGRLTIMVSFFCIILYVWAVFTAPPQIEFSGHTLNIGLTFTPPYSALVYEDPLAFQYAYDFSKDYQATSDKAAYLKTQEAFKKLYRYETTPYWHGFYGTYLVPSQSYASLNKSFAYTPTFEQISQGEVWRLVTPAFLHANLFHILFNLLWFVFLGNQIESRIGFWKFALFITLVAIVSNTAQYLMSGPNFLGLSGVVLGMAGFVFVRQAKAAWEGYSTQRSTLYFLAFYVLALVILQIVSFALELSGKAGIAPNIANTAHVVGALCGLALGSLNFFSAWNLDKLKK